MQVRIIRVHMYILYICRLNYAANNIYLADYEAFNVFSFNIIAQTRSREYLNKNKLY